CSMDVVDVDNVTYVIEGDRKNELIVNGSISNDSSLCVSAWGLDPFRLDGYLRVCEFILTVACWCSAPLQLYVMRKAVSHIERRTGDQCLHIFLLSMTLGDFFLTAFCYPIELLPSLIEQGFPLFINSLMHIMTWIGLMVSSLSLVLLNVDKLLYFKYPLRYAVYINRSRALSIIGVLWMGCGTFVITIWLAGCFECFGENCQGIKLFNSTKGLYLGFMLFVCILPIVSSLLVACYVLSVVTKHKRALAEEQALCRSSQGSTASHMVKSRLKTFYFIFMSSVVTAATLLPYRITNAQGIFHEMMDDWKLADGAVKPIIIHTLSPCPLTLLRFAMSYLLQVNAILNPIMTVTILPQYRLNCSRLFWWNAKKRSEAVETTTMRTRCATDL
ncbi:aexr-3, partial [Pristionchus pacificus]